MNAAPISRALTAFLLALGLFTSAAPAARHRAEDPPDVQGLPRVDNLPLIKVPAKGPGGDEFAVLLTGDGGWAETDRGLSKALVKGGVPVVGWNSLHYFLKRREPDRAARDLERILRHFLLLWHKEKVILIGYSFGADVMPFLAARLPADLAEKVSMIALLGPSESADFRFHPREWLGKPSPEYRPVPPEIEKLAGKEILCFYGETEKKTTLCLKLRAGLVQPLARPGTHIVGKNYGPIAAAILAHRRTTP
ncbi:MAG TPA: AcvB/VirJ family lysyl-phosphatidylglycerol hydrolase [Thermoanaerobaculia bacterium]|nr:AcvB/VirJ family lysyl-phosphatidylglycerol hydrolase [Thermoanaerobaculia bacterium]